MSIPDTCKRYVEPFAGSACVFLSAIKGDAVLADFNHDLINAFNAVKLHPRIVARRLESLTPDKVTYYRVRENGTGSSDIDKAVRFIFLNAHCFNGVYRTNRSGKFNVPMGTKTGGVPTENHLVRCSIALRTVRVVCQDYMETLSQCAKDDFIYLDPTVPEGRISRSR
jgi:DNA adenine methylase